MQFHQLKQFAHGERRHAAAGQLCPSPLLGRRRFMLGSAAALAVACHPAEADVPVPYDWNATPPMDDKLSFIEWMARNRGEEAGFLGQRWDRFRQAVAGRDLWDRRDMRAFLLTPREHFVTNPNLSRAYGPHPLGIGYGVTISDPHIVARMTSALNVARGDKVLEVGTGSGYQSAYLANLTDKVWSIEIIKPLAERTRRLYDSLIERGYDEYKSITTRHADGLLRLGAGGSLRQGHRHLRHRPYPAAAVTADEAEWHHGDPGRPARRPARAQGHQAAGGRRLDQRRALGHLSGRPSCLRAVHQARRRLDQRHPQRK
jgi:Protein-L-isoaspartate(D-aspartate) O-methyltransferase (PCMT)